MATITGQPLHFDGPATLTATDGRPTLRATLRVEAPIVFVPHFRVAIDPAGGPRFESDSGATFYVGWLPRGSYRVDLVLPAPLAPGAARYAMEARHRVAMEDVPASHIEGGFVMPAETGTHPETWAVEGTAPTQPLAALSWRKGHEDWFFRHFDHAALTIQSYLLGDSPLLRGRILDVGCGDGITDLGLALRTGCRELVGVDPFKGYERLAAVLAENRLPADIVPPTLRFLPESANALPFEDDRFDVVVSWGSVEHIAGGYDQALREMRRVLRPDGLLFIHPGLYYSAYGHHLGEFSSEPHFHLKKPIEEVKRIVFEAPFSSMDRSGLVATREEYWQWFRELNPITVARFEQELRALDFQPWRVALRTEGLVEYTAEIERYPMQDLATSEVYISCFNRKARR